MLEPALAEAKVMRGLSILDIGCGWRFRDRICQSVHPSDKLWPRCIQANADIGPATGCSYKNLADLCRRLVLSLCCGSDLIGSASRSPVPMIQDQVTLKLSREEAGRHPETPPVCGLLII
jgi:hypothetical protein